MSLLQRTGLLRLSQILNQHRHHLHLLGHGDTSDGANRPYKLSQPIEVPVCLPIRTTAISRTKCCAQPIIPKESVEGVSHLLDQCIRLHLALHLVPLHTW